MESSNIEKFIKNMYVPFSKVYFEKHHKEAERINAIFQKWGFDPNDNVLFLISSEDYQTHIGKHESIFKKSDFLELAKLIFFLQQTEGNAITFDSTVKGQPIKVKLESEETIKMLNLWANSRLNEINYMGNRYSGIAEKKNKYQFDEGIEDTFYTEEYTTSEIKKIIELEEELIRTSIPENKEMNLFLKNMNHAFNRSGIFKKEKERGEITREYNLLYDIIVYVGYITEDESKNKNDRFRYVRDAINSINNLGQKLSKKYIE